MRALVVGGPQAGQWVDLPDGLAVWIDLLHGDTLPVSYVTWAIPGPDGAQVLYRLPVAVHPSAGDPVAVQQVVINHAMTFFMAAHAQRQEVPPPPPVVPDTPAALFGADGRPLGGMG